MTKNVLLLTRGIGRGRAERPLASGIGHIDGSCYHMEVAYLPVSLPQVVVIRDGADAAMVPSSAEAHGEARLQLGLPEGEQVVGTVGNLTAKKNDAFLLRPIAVLIAEPRPVRVVLVGTVLGLS